MLLKVFHWGPLTALGIIKIITWLTIHCLSMWWPPWSTFGSSINISLFLSLSGATLYYFLSALSLGPGYVPLEWKPKNEEDINYLQFCVQCQGYKAPRAHHCRQCGRCVKKMDHHCPWINGCVGWANHTHFALFLLFATLGSLQGGIIMVCSIYNALQRPYYTPHGYVMPTVRLTLTSLAGIVLALGLAIGVVLAVGMLFYFQVRSMFRNRTSIEDWILEKALYRNPDFIFPYNLGNWRVNFRHINGLPNENGMYWHVAPNCDQYTLTMEQLAQKALKRQRIKTYVTISAVAGRYCPLLAYRSAAIRPPTAPCIETRLALEPGDKIGVTRWRRHWLFGEKIQETGNGPRGWFPRNAVEAIPDSPSPNKKSQ